MILRITIDGFGGKLEMSTITALLFAYLIYRKIENYKQEKKRKEKHGSQ